MRDQCFTNADFILRSMHFQRDNSQSQRGNSQPAGHWVLREFWPDYMLSNSQHNTISEREQVWFKAQAEVVSLISIHGTDILLNYKLLCF